MGRCDDQVFVYAGLFLLCSLVSALGGAAFGMLLFIVASLAAALFLPSRRQRQCQSREFLSCGDH